MDKIIMLLQFIIGLLIIVGIHELGHLLFAKLFGIKVESYGIGFPPKIFSKQYKDTEYYIGAIPLGGAVKLAGMAEEYTEEDDAPNPNPWDYRSKPAWQKLIVMFGGILFNAITGIVIYSCITFHTGQDYLSKEEVNKLGVVPNDIGEKIGFQDGDKVIKINGKDFKGFSEIFDQIHTLAHNTTYTVERNGTNITITIPADIQNELENENTKYIFLQPRITPIVSKVFPNSQAEHSGIKEKDIILKINETHTPYLHNLQQALQKNVDKSVNLTYQRDNQIYNTTVKVSTIGHIGIEIASNLKYSHKDYGIIESILAGAKKAYRVVELNTVGLKKLLTGKVSASKSLTGPIGIARIFGSKFSFMNFWNIVAFLSLGIAIINTLPIPAMDGGHAILLIYEMIIGKKISPRILLIIQKIGIGLLLLLALYTTINDITKIFN